MLPYITPRAPSVSSHEINVPMWFIGKVSLSLSELHNVRGWGQQNLNLTAKVLVAPCPYSTISDPERADFPSGDEGVTGHSSF